MSITPRGMSIQEAYRLYRDDGLIVNRKYQRKLVWKMSEKQNLIDSLLNDYPIPLILLADKSESNKPIFEIIDGMQRLNAIFSFIENKYPVDNKFFDTSEFTRARQASEQGHFKVVDKEVSNFFSPAICADILDYQLAITTFPIKSEDQITDVFARINSGGKQLSSQEKRQAGMTDAFSLVVRELSSDIRGDVSKETLPLSEMPEISIESSRNRFGYALSAEKIFWCYQGVLWASNLRESEDEEILADICASLVLGKPITSSKVYYDKIYSKEEKEYELIRREFSSFGKERLFEEVKVTLSTLQAVINEFCPDRFALRDLVSPKGTNPIKETFFSIFMAFHKLIIEEEKTPVDYKEIMNALSGLHKQIVSTSSSKPESRIRNIDSVTGLIQRYFVKKDKPMLKHGVGLAMDLVNALTRSRIETSRYECKQGLLDLSPKRTRDKKLPDKIINTICAIANVGPDSDGFIFIGVTDNESDAQVIEKLDDLKAVTVGNRFIVGLEREMKIISMGEEQYIDVLLSKIRESKLSEPLKSQVLTQIDYITYKGLSVLRLRIPAQSELSSIDEEFYIRENSSTVKIDGIKLIAASKMFN